MKKFFAAVAVLLLLTGCGSSAPEPEAELSEEPPVVEEMIPEAPVEQEEPVLPEETPAVSHEAQVLEGLVGDAVAYCYKYPEITDLPGAEAINEFYAELAENMVAYAQNKVFSTAADKYTVADVTGQYALAEDADTVAITYTVTVLYGDDTADQFDRTDVFDRVTGETVTHP